MTKAWTIAFGASLALLALGTSCGVKTDLISYVDWQASQEKTQQAAEKPPAQAPQSRFLPAESRGPR